MRLVSGSQAMVQLRDKSFERFGNDEHDVVGGGYGSVGVKLTGNISLEAFAEGGNFAADSAAGFDYYLVGANLKALF